MLPAKPSLELLRSLTDEHVLRALMDETRLTRAEVAARTGISKPTVSDSVRRLSEAGLVRDTGERTRGRGRTGSYYGLAPDLGSALVVSIAPEGVVAEGVDVHGRVVKEATIAIGRAASPSVAGRSLRAAARQVVSGRPGPVRVAVVSVADPVDRSGRVVQLPDAPFLAGELSPVDLLLPLVSGPVLVDNDVHWAARAERQVAAPEALDNFVYLYLGDGMGCAVVSDEEVRRGHRGIGGEVAHMVTVGPAGQAMLLTEVFAALGLRRPGSTAIDSESLTSRANEPTERARGLRAAVARAVSGALSSLVAIADPEVIVVGGPWGTDAQMIESIRSEFSAFPRRVPVRPARALAGAALIGARHQAVHELRSAVLAGRGPLRRPRPSRAGGPSQGSPKRRSAHGGEQLGPGVLQCHHNGPAE